MTFAKALKQARDSLGMTQMELSKALHVSFSTINRYENGKHFPNPIFLDAIKAYFASKSVSLEFDAETEAMAIHGNEDK